MLLEYKACVSHYLEKRGGNTAIRSHSAGIMLETIRSREKEAQGLIVKRSPEVYFSQARAKQAEVIPFCLPKMIAIEQTESELSNKSHR